MPEPPGGFESRSTSIDLDKRYDVYCTDPGNKMTVYKNVQFKGKRFLFGGGSTSFSDRFVELEQSNGDSVYVSEFSITMFCEHGGEIV